MSTTSTDLQTKINEILTSASPEQIRWVFARLTTKTDKDAAKIIGMNNATVSRWENKSNLDKAVKMLLIDPIFAAIETLRLAAPEAAGVLVRELKGKQKRQAANDVLDRAGVAKLTKVAPTDPTGEKEYEPDRHAGQRLALIRQLVDAEQAKNSGPDIDK